MHSTDRSSDQEGHRSINALCAALFLRICGSAPFKTHMQAIVAPNTIDLPRRCRRMRVYPLVPGRPKAC